MNSKINTVLLVVVILLLGAGFWMINKKPVVNTPPVVATTPAISGDVGNFVSFSIAPGSTVSGVMAATGSVKGAYFFEANMIAQILDANKNILKSAPAAATTD